MQNLKDRIVKSIMVQEVIAVKTSDNALFVLEVFNKYHVSSVPVLNEEGDRVVGFIGERTLLKMLGDKLLSAQPELPDVSRLMTQEALIINEQDSVMSVLQLLSEYGVKSALVMDAQEHLSGVITRRELLMSMEDCAHYEHGMKHSHRLPVRITETYRERSQLTLSIQKPS